jgi:hypothetical protein
MTALSIAGKQESPAAAGQRPSLARIASRLHAAADERAAARGWTITPAPGLLGTTSRIYRDPRFDSLTHRHGQDGRR